MNRNPASRGLALLVVCGVLGVLSILAMCFLTLAQLERKATQRRMHQTRAFLLARSGLEDALARLDAGQDPSGLRSRYLGEDWDASGTLNGLEGPAEVFKRGTLNQGDCPLPQALRPSWALMDNLGKPVLVPVDGRDRGYSGRLSALTDATLTYSLKVEDESGKINVNGGFLDAVDRDGDGVADVIDPDVKLVASTSDTGTGWNLQLWRVLGILGAQPEVGIPTLATLVRTNRPVGGYRSIVHLQSMIGATTDLSPFLTTSSWIDTSVIHPNALVLALNSTREASDLKRTRLPLALEAGGRPPVNLNIASRAVLQALTGDLSGICAYYPPAASVQVTTFTNTAVRNAIVNQIVARRDATPFTGWADFEAFCDSLIPVIQPLTLQTNNLVAYAVDVLKANFNPNSNLNKQIPDQLLWHWVDKSDLRVWSTEGCFSPTGSFQLTAVGRVRGTGGRLLAERRLGMSVNAFSLLRQTTQKDFVAGRSPDASSTSYVSLATGNYPTTGSTAPWHVGSPGQGMAVLTYPCAMTALPTSLPGAVDNAADFDGCIGLATTQYRDPSESTLRFLHEFNGWDADKAGPTPCGTRINGPNGAAIQTELKTSVWPASGEPSTFLPDGAYVQNGRCPAFPAIGNLPDTTWTAGLDPLDPARLVAGNHAVVSLWVKTAQYYGMMYEFQVAKSSAPIASSTQQLLLGHVSTEGATQGWGICYESSVFYEANCERQSFVTKTLDSSIPTHPGDRWRLLTCLFDSNEFSADDERSNLSSLEGSFTAGQRPGAYGLVNASHTSDLLWDAVLGDSLLCLGNQGPTKTQNGPRSNSVIDSVAICDFGDVSGPAILAMGDLARNRFSDGRYYKENDGRFLSAVLNPDQGRSVRILSASWTAVLPRETRKELVEPNPSWTLRNRTLDVSLRDADVLVDLLPSGGDLNSVSPVAKPLSQGGVIRQAFRGFRYRITFRPTPNWPAVDRITKPVLETPFFDDITFAWQPQSGPRVLAWSER